MKIVDHRGQTLWLDNRGIHETPLGLGKFAALDEVPIPPSQLASAQLFVAKHFRYNPPGSANRTKSSSYHYKHCAEHFIEQENLDPNVFSHYVSNGALILAAYLAGFPIFHIQGLNCYFRARVARSLEVSCYA